MEQSNQKKGKVYVINPCGDGWTVGECVRAAGQLMTRFQRDYFEASGYEIINMHGTECKDPPIAYLNHIDKWVHEPIVAKNLLERIEKQMSEEYDSHAIVWFHEMFGLWTCMKDRKIQILKEKYPKRIHLIGWQDDLHAKFDWKMILSVLDALLCPYDIQYMKEQVARYIPNDVIHKVYTFYYFVPSFRIQDNDDTEQEWKKRKSQKVLLTGRIHGRVYPLREKYSNNKNVHTYTHHKILETGEHKNNEYFEVLKDYQSSIATSAKNMYYCLAKYLEIAAMQTFMICELHPQLKDMGFIDGVHYVGLNDKNVENAAIKQDDESFRKRYNIAKNAIQVIREKHTDTARAKDLVSFFDQHFLF